MAASHVAAKFSRSGGVDNLTGVPRLLQATTHQLLVAPPFQRQGFTESQHKRGGQGADGPQAVTHGRRTVNSEGEEGGGVRHGRRRQVVLNVWQCLPGSGAEVAGDGVQVPRVTRERAFLRPLETQFVAADPGKHPASTGSTQAAVQLVHGFGVGAVRGAAGPTTCPGTGWVEGAELRDGHGQVGAGGSRRTTTQGRSAHGLTTGRRPLRRKSAANAATAPRSNRNRNRNARSRAVRGTRHPKMRREGAFVLHVPADH